MKAAVLVGVVGSALGGVASGAAALFPNSPLLLWSAERPIFNGQNAYSSAVMDQHDILSALTEVAKRDRNVDDWGIIGEQREPFEPAELLCVFMVPSLRGKDLVKFAAEGEQSFVQQAVESADSSVVVRHTTRSSPLRDVLAETAPVISYNELSTFTSEGGGWNSLLSDGKTDVVVVEINDVEDWQQVDNEINKASELLTLATQGLVDFVLAADTTEPAKIVTRQLAEKTSTTTAAIVCDAGYLIGYSAAGKAFCFSHYVNMTPDILTALLFGLLFIFLAYVGLSVLHGIQTPLRYPLHGPPRGKEF